MSWCQHGKWMIQLLCVSYCSWNVWGWQMFALTVTVFPQTGDVSWWLALSPCMLSCLPAAQIPCCSGHLLAAPSCRHSRSLTSAETSHQSYTETRGLPTLMCLQIWHFGGKNLEPACGRVSWCFLLGAGSSSPGVTGASPRVCWDPWSESWVFTDCLVKNTCWAWAVVSPGQMLVGLP